MDSMPSTSSSIKVSSPNINTQLHVDNTVSPSGFLPTSYSVALSLLTASIAGDALNLWVTWVNNAIKLFPTQEHAWCPLTSWSQLSHIIPSGTTYTTRYHSVRRISHLKPCTKWAKNGSVVESSFLISDYFCTSVQKFCWIKCCLNPWGCKTSSFDLPGTLSPNL